MAGGCRLPVKRVQKKAEWCNSRAPANRSGGSRSRLHRYNTDGSGAPVQPGTSYIRRKYRSWRKAHHVPGRLTATDLPDDSALLRRLTAGDFLDCYSVVADIPPRRAAEIITDFPQWVRFLLTIRRILTVPFGLSNDGPRAPDKIGIFPVESETGHELIAGFNDRHLDFRVSVLSQKGLVFLATWVHPHNIGGRIYLAAIIPFHILVARKALARVGRVVSA